MSGNNNTPQQRGFRPSGPIRVGRVGEWGSSSGGSGSSGPRPGSSNRITGFSALNAGSSQPSAGGRRSGGRGHSDDEDDESDDGGGETTFAGGERSGLSIQNPGRGGGDEGGRSGSGMVGNILKIAADNGRERQSREAPRSESRFSGGGYRLGGDEVDSAFIPDPNARNDPSQVATRYITFWRNGFTIANGPLRPYEDEESKRILMALMDGTAPISLLDVEPGQEVDLQISERRGEEYVEPPSARAWRGEGNRLGAPVPSEGSGSTSMPGGFPSASGSGSSAARAEPQSVTTQFEVDQSLPTTSVQIRLADGTRMVARMNLTHTVGDIRNFINASRPENRTREYTIATTFPNRVLSDDKKTIEEEGLKNSVVVQRWA